MGKRPTNSETIYRIIEKVGPVSTNNVYNFVGKGTYLSKSINLKTAAERLVGWELAKKADINELYPKRFTTLYYLSNQKFEKYQNHQFSHDSAVKDIVVAFYSIFEEERRFQFKVYYEVKFDHGEGYIKQDAFIELTYINDWKYYFIIEVETRRKPNEIYKEKISKYEKVLKKGLNPLKNIGSKPLFNQSIDNRTKILFFVTPYEFNRFTFARPEVSEKEAKQFQDKTDYIYIDNRRKKLETEHAKDIATSLPDNFLFAPLHKFNQLDQPIFYQKQGNQIVKRPLINKL